MSREARHPITGSIMKIAGYGGVSNDHMTEVLRDAEVVSGKNKLNNTALSKVADGITWTVNTDKTVLGNGTASAITYITIDEHFNSTKYAGHIISGLPIESDSTVIYRIHSQSNYTGIQDITTNGATITDNGSDLRLSIRIAQNRTLNNYLFKPMICSAEEWNKSHDYEPYYVPVKDAMLRRSEQRVLGAKNLFINTAATETKNGITLTANSDGTLKLNGTPTDETVFNIMGSTNGALTSPWQDSLKGYDLHLTGCPSDGADDKYFIGLVKNDGTESRYKDYGDGVTFNYTAGTYRAYIVVRNGVTINNEVFKPMIRLASDPDDTYVPYAMTNRELTDKVNHISDAQANMAYAKHVASSSSAKTYTITCTNPYQNFLITASSGGPNLSFHIVYKFTDTAIANKEVDKINQGVGGLTFTNINQFVFTIATPGYVHLNIISALPFTVS